jgi:hypothetical protein
VADTDQLVGRAQKTMYRNLVDVVEEEFRIMTLDVAARRVTREAGRSAIADEVLQRLQTTGRNYNAPHLDAALDLVVLDENRKAMSTEILAAGAHALIICNYNGTTCPTKCERLAPGFDACTKAWIAEAARRGVKAEHVGRCEYAYQDKAAERHACMTGSVRIVDSGQILVVTVTNYYGRYHVLQARALSEGNAAVERECFEPVAT